MLKNQLINKTEILNNNLDLKITIKMDKTTIRMDRITIRMEMIQ